MSYIVTPTQQEAETIQRYIHNKEMEAQYNEYIPSAITAEELRIMYGATKPFLECTIDQRWLEGYNKILGFKNGEIQTNFKGAATNYYEPIMTADNKWAIKQPAQQIDLTTFSFELVQDNGTLFPLIEIN